MQRPVSSMVSIISIRGYTAFPAAMCVFHDIGGAPGWRGRCNRSQTSYVTSNSISLGAAKPRMTPKVIISGPWLKNMDYGRPLYSNILREYLTWTFWYTWTPPMVFLSWAALNPIILPQRYTRPYCPGNRLPQYSIERAPP